VPTSNRDLASAQLWERSLERSRRRRALADSARREISRRKTATYAVSAAVATSPMYPGISSAVNDLSGKDVNKIAHKLEHRDVRRVLLEFGDKSPAVKALQKKLEIPEDGVFGPQTKAAVRDFQKSAGLATTGDVDVKTWLKLFPDDMIVYAPPGAANALGANSAQTAQWSAVNAGDPAAALASVSDRRGAHKGSKSNARSRTRDALAHAASFPGLEPDQGEQPGGSDLPGPTGTVPDVTPPVSPPVSPSPPSGGHGGVPVPGGNGPSVPQAPPSFPTPGGSVGQILKTIIAAADRIDSKGYAYSWGGGHNMGFSGPYDCSGAVSAVLHAAGLLKRPMVSGEFMHWGAPGPGSVTIYANAGHVYMSILGRYFGTSSANPAGGAGWFKGGPRPGFAVVHVPFSAMHLKDVAALKRKKAKVRAKKRRAARRQAAQREAASAPYNGPSGGTAAGTSSGQQAPDQGSQPSPQPAPQQSAPAPAPVPTPAPPPAPVNPAPAPAPVTPAPPVQHQGSAPAPAQPAPAPQQQSAPAQQAPAQQAPAQPAPQQSAPAPAPAPQAPAQPAPQPSAPSTPAPQAPAVPAPQAPAQPAPQPSAPSTPAPQAPAPHESAPAGNPAAAQPVTPPATAPKPAGGDSAGGDSGAAASG
jgi:peptidoglycan hydrolase-like protein with peptidoglycan-binding domain